MLCPICGTWARETLWADHHPNCCLRTESLLALLRPLVTGIHKWAEEGDGVPDWLWDDFFKAKLLLEEVDSAAGPTPADS